MKLIDKILEHDDLKGNEKLIAVIIARYGKENGVEFSYSELAHYAGVTRKTAYSVVQRMKEKGLLEVEGRQNESNLYRLKL